MHEFKSSGWREGSAGSGSIVNSFELETIAVAGTQAGRKWFEWFERVNTRSNWKINAVAVGVALAVVVAGRQEVIRSLICSN